MPKVARRNNNRPPNRSTPDRLPLRWVLIGMLTAAGGAAGFVSSGPVAGPVTAIVTGCAVATAAHRLIA
ncbi:hypothetical protein [Mycolicibacterium aubagnense]|uniref:Uncharacterized protein n=1 Tax=Mycolicibacterium aubagnense TaxID=319707 RepID=A0ABN5Z2P3_9MYCO|nr:hypothetical protein [Mycolicibacterium aubagnense]TLH49051.1 hypothetical protein C1S80_28960 [Mycolicibacterium aubagnense]BBX88213.1 hypothetical protein MAUB_64140 [Mycolicibacterium aubagnense]